MAAEAPTTRYELLDYVPAADPRATVVVGDARFTVLTPRVLRMEYRGAAIFEDRPTLAFVNRRQPVPPFKWHAAAGALTTGFLRLRYTGGPFSADSLWVEPAPAALRGMGAFGGWRFGQRDASNLRGTIRTLDRKNNVSLSCDGGASAGGAGGGAGGGGGGSSGGGNGSGWAVVDLDSSGHCTWGVVSRSGWALVNDTGAPCLDAADDWWADETGVMLRNRNRHDLYLFAHGADFRGALRDFTAVGGAVPLPPRYQLGVLFSRWYDYDTEGVQSLVRQFERRRLPLDGLILDMSWHTKPAWTGYTWDGHLYPDPADLTGWLRRRGLAVGANLHDAGGVGAWEASYARVAAAMGVILGAGVPLSLTNKTYLFALEDITLAALEESGIDFWWIDWQQGESSAGTGQDGLPDGKMNPTIWTAKARATDPKRRAVQAAEREGREGRAEQGQGRAGLRAEAARRGAESERGSASGGGKALPRALPRGGMLSRWGGLGQHRYQIGFSGDVAELSWPNLAYQAYFSATSSNVGFGFWSHDIVGPGDDPEMHVRWLQLGSLSPIFRMHDRGLSAGDCSGWPPQSQRAPTRARHRGGKRGGTQPQRGGQEVTGAKPLPEVGQPRRLRALSQAGGRALSPKNSTPPSQNRRAAAAAADVKPTPDGGTENSPLQEESTSAAGPEDSAPRVCANVEPWRLFGSFYSAAASALRRRAALLPYLYTAAREAHDTGVGLARPMYYYYGQEKAAYPRNMEGGLGQEPSTRQYFLGGEMLVAPVTAPAECVAIAQGGAAGGGGPAAAKQAAGRPDSATLSDAAAHSDVVTPSDSAFAHADAPPVASAEPCGLTPHEVWLPPGTWVELPSGIVASGPATLQRRVHLLDVPVYVRAGAVLPRAAEGVEERAEGRAEGRAQGRVVGGAARASPAIEWAIYPWREATGEAGRVGGQGTLYDDDGRSTDYLNPDGVVWTSLVYSYTRVAYSGSGSEDQIGRAGVATQLDITVAVGATPAKAEQPENPAFPEEASAFPQKDLLPADRTHSLRLVNAWPPDRVEIFVGGTSAGRPSTMNPSNSPQNNSMVLPYSRHSAVPGCGCWTYDGPEASVVVHLPSMGLQTAHASSTETVSTEDGEAPSTETGYAGAASAPPPAMRVRILTADIGGGAGGASIIRPAASSVAPESARPANLPRALSGAEATAPPRTLEGSGWMDRSLVLDGVKGVIAAARRAKRVMDDARVAPGAQVPDPAGAPLTRLATLGTALSAYAADGPPFARFAAAAANATAAHAAALAQLGGLVQEYASNRPDRAARANFAREIMAAAALGGIDRGQQY